MTDREKLIELLNEANEKLKELCGGLNDNNGNGVRADHLIANGVTVQKWIPVTERLPKREDANLYESVLAINKEDGVPKAQEVLW